MKKKWIFCICMYLFLMVFGGCGAQIPDMTEEERKAISEYAVDLLLKYDTSQPSRLVDLEEMEEPEATVEPEATAEPEATEEPESTPEPTVTPEPETTFMPEETIPPQEVPEIEVSDPLEETLLLPKGVTLTYKDYQPEDIYVDEVDGYQTLEAENGKKLLVIHFSLLNSSSVTQDIDMLQDNIVYKVILDDAVINGMVTMIRNDLTTYIGSLEPEESVELVLLAEVGEDALQTDSTIKVIFLRQENVSEVIIK